ncbi:Cytochrome b5 [Diplonema papillatum]|nr:Cytochrome b5 [Diplonema papillatum]KAJ9465777.1 Cytochrome b5 [Diplonema papillatum]
MTWNPRRTISGSDADLRRVTRQELEAHSSREDAWTLIHKRVYNVTDFLLVHPGGADVLCQYAGVDATEEWELVGHNSKKVAHTMRELLVGVCEERPTREVKRASMVPMDDAAHTWSFEIGLALVVASSFLLGCYLFLT